MSRPALAPISAPVRQAGVLLEMIKFQHTVFALPFALMGMVLAADVSGRWPSWRTAAWVVACCVFARTAAMAFNRWSDADFDARNPRTVTRAIPAGLLSRRYVLAVALVSAALFVVCAGMLNRLALLLSPAALAVLLGYSYCKRFTSGSHFVLGLALGIAPIGAWVAVRGELHPVALLLGLAVLLWTAGFDIIYACQDVEVDRREGLHSIPARLGVPAALLLSRVLHAATLSALLGVGILAGMHWPWFAGTAAVGVLLLTQHLLVNPRDLSRISIAFFTVNSWVGVVMFLFTMLDLLLY